MFLLAATTCSEAQLNELKRDHATLVIKDVAKSAQRVPSIAKRTAGKFEDPFHNTPCVLLQ